MTATQELHETGQSLWLDNLTRGLLTSGTLRHYIQEFSVTGLTSNSTIFDHAIKNSDDYDDAVRQKVRAGKSGEALFFELALEDLRQAADLLRPRNSFVGVGEKAPTVVKLAVRSIPTSGTPAELLSAAGIDAEHIAQAVGECL